MDEEEVLDNGTRCPGCNTRQAHEILKEKVLKNDAGIDYLLRCEGCSNVHTMEFRTPKPVLVKFTLSDGAVSTPYEMEVDEDEIDITLDVIEKSAVIISNVLIITLKCKNKCGKTKNPATGDISKIVRMCVHLSVRAHPGRRLLNQCK